MKKPWTIYNNDKRWGALDDVSKGALLLHAHGGGKLLVDDIPITNPAFNLPERLYRAVKELEMWEILEKDLSSHAGLTGDSWYKELIAMGWTKKND